MNIINKLKIGQRLAIAFLLLISFMLVQTIISWIDLNSVQKDFDLVVKDRLIKVQLATEVENLLNKQARALRSMLITTDQSVIDRERNKIISSVPLAKECVDKLQSTIYTAQGKTALALVQKNQAVYFYQQDRVLGLIKQGKVEDAKLALMQYALPAQDEYLRSIEELVVSQTNAINDFSNQAQIESASGKSWLLGLSISGMIVAAFVAYLITKSVTRPLVQLRNTIEQVKLKSNFGIRAQVSGRDEISLTSEFFNNLMTSLQTAIVEVNKVATAIANGEFGERVKIDLHGDLGTMKMSLNASAMSVEGTMSALADVMQALKHGNFSVRMSSNVKGDVREIVDSAMNSTEILLNEVSEVMSHVQRGNLSPRVQSMCEGQLEMIKTSINTSLDELSKVMKDVLSNTQQVAAATSQTATAISQISDGAQTQTLAISQVDIAIKETAASVLEVSQNTEAASEQSKESVQVVKRSKTQVLTMLEVVNTIASNSEKINKITEIIESIANKTNLLSLNAAIEAARAGEHGRGFSVVAQEVGTLAANSGQSAKEINALISEAVIQTRTAVATANKVAAEMDLIEQSAVSTDGLLTRIATAIEQQSSAIQEIEGNFSSLNEIAHSNASASEQITSSIMELSKIAEQTRIIVNKFQI